MREMVVLLTRDAADVFFPAREVDMLDKDFVKKLRNADNLNSAQDLIDGTLSGEWLVPVFPVDTSEKKADLSTLWETDGEGVDMAYVKNFLGKTKIVSLFLSKAVNNSNVLVVDRDGREATVF